MEEIDIVIVSDARNEFLFDSTNKTIASLIESEPNIKFNIFIVESNKNISYDKKEQNILIKTIYPTTSFGYHKYLNLGIKEGGSKYVVLCNNDLLFENNWASEIIEVMQSDESILSASPFCNETQGDNKKYAREYFLGYRVRGEVNGWCIFQQRKIYDQIKELNEDVIFWYSDDIYAFELELRNIKHALVTSSIVHHHNNNIGLSILKDKQELYTNGQFEEYLKSAKKIKNNLLNIQ